MLDRQPASAQVTRCANAGEVSPGYSTPRAAPGIPMKALEWTFKWLAPLIVQPRPELAKLFWLARMLVSCSPETYKLDKSRMLRLAQYSRDGLQASGDCGLPWRRAGTRGRQGRHCRRLASSWDRTEDGFKFAQALAGLSAAAGVAYRYRVGVDALCWTMVAYIENPVMTDAVLVALGPIPQPWARVLNGSCPFIPSRAIRWRCPFERRCARLNHGDRALLGCDHSPR